MPTAAWWTNWSAGSPSPLSDRSVSSPEGTPPRGELRPTVGTAGAAALAFVSWKVVASTGQALGIAVCFAALAAIVLDAVWAILATRRVRVTASVARRDIVVGETIVIDVVVEGPHQAFTVRISEGSGGLPKVVDAPGAGPLGATTTTRGVMSGVEIERISNGFCGLAAFSRRERIGLPQALYVGPRPLPPAQPFPELGRGVGDGPARPGPEGDSVRSVRAYVPGDPQRQVHWRSSAHHGDLVVKEVALPSAPALTILVDLGAGGEAGERAARRAGWYTREALRRGYRVMLATHDRTGRVIDVVGSTTEINRRLAVVVPGSPGPSPSPSAGHAVLSVRDTGDCWE